MNAAIIFAIAIDRKPMGDKDATATLAFYQRPAFEHSAMRVAHRAI